MPKKQVWLLITLTTIYTLLLCICLWLNITPWIANLIHLPACIFISYNWDNLYFDHLKPFFTRLFNQ